MQSDFKNFWDDQYDSVEHSRLLAEIKTEVVHERIARSILVALSGKVNGMTTIELELSTKCRRSRFLKTIKRLVELQKVFKSPVGKKTQPFRYRLSAWY